MIDILMMSMNDDEYDDDDCITLSVLYLLQLPVLLVIRLCTSEEAVVQYWNNIDSQLEIDVDVLDDQAGNVMHNSLFYKDMIIMILP